jgi:hypothetical protein
VSDGRGLSFFNRTHSDEKTFLSDFSDPFAVKNIESVHIHIYPKRGSFRASVEFEMKNTKGSQAIEADSYDGLIKKIEEFTKDL